MYVSVRIEIGNSWNWLATDELKNGNKNRIINLFVSQILKCLFLKKLIKYFVGVILTLRNLIP